MFMKHTISRFFRFFLVAALVAAMAGSLLPVAKVAGQAACVPAAATTDPQADAVVCATVTNNAAGEATGWTIKFVSPLLDGAFVAPATDETATDVELRFAGATVTEVPMVGDPAAPISTEGLITVNGTPVEEFMATTSAITFTPPEDVASGTVTVVVASSYEDDANTAITTNSGIAGTDRTVQVSVSGTPVETSSAAAETYNRPTPTLPKDLELNAGQVARWDVTSMNVADGLSKDEHEITLTFSSGTVPSSIDKNAIRLISSTPAGEDITRAGSPALAPSVTGKTIRFISPVDVTEAATATLRVIIAEAAGVAAPGQPGTMTLTIQAGDNNVAATSAPVTVGRYISFAPVKAKRGATITVSGGGFTSGTSGDIKIGKEIDDDPGPTGGVFTVDSSGKLTGSFVASANTKNGGQIYVQDLGAKESDPVWSTDTFSQSASAKPAATEVALGSPVRVTLNDFPADTAVNATLAGGEAAPLTTSTGADAITNDKGGGTFNLAIPQTAGPGTKQVSVTAGTKSASFLVTIVRRTLSVSPSSAVPGQAITVSGSGFTTGGGVTVDLTLGVGSDPHQVIAKEIGVNTDGTFLYTGKVPFSEATGAAGAPGTSAALTWTGTEDTSTSRKATSSGFSIQKRVITLSPSTANPGATVEVFGSGWGVRTYGDDTSQVTIELSNSKATFGPFPVTSTGEFTGAFTVPANSSVSMIRVTATDNNGGRSETESTPPVVSIVQGKTGGFAQDKSAGKNLSVPTGVVTVSPDTASTGTIITVTGKGFAAQTNLSGLSFGGSNALPVPAPATDVQGNFTVTLTVPAASQGGSQPPGAVVITATVGMISGTTSFTIPGPSITLSGDSARPGESLTITGTGFSAYANVDSVNFGSAPALPVPNPRTDGVGDFSASVIVPTLNPGAYTITVRTGPSFTATSPVAILSATSGRTVSPEIAFQSLTSRGLLTLAAAAAPGGTEFGAFVPGLAGNTLAQVEPNGVLILTLNADARISVSSQPAVSVSADTPTFFALGAAVTIEVIE